MSKKVFVPITDELLEKHPELIAGVLKPFNAGVACHHWLEQEIEWAQQPTRTVPERRRADWLLTVRRRFKAPDPGSARPSSADGNGAFRRRSKLVPV